MDLSPTRTTSTLSDSKDWLASQHGLDSRETVTLDIANGGFGFTAAAGGIVPQSTPIKLHAASGMYRRAGTEEKADGHVFENVRVRPGSTSVGASLHWHGSVVVSKVATPFTEANRADHIRYV